MNTCCHQPQHKPEHGAGKARPDYLLWVSLTGVFVLFVAGTFFEPSLASYPWLQTMAETTVHMLHAMWWGIAVGFLFVGVLSKIPRSFIMALLGRGGTFGGLLRATGAGVLLDLCSHGILMVGTKLYERGASAGQVVAFLIASPWNSFSLTLILIGLIGLPWTLAFIVLSMLLALLTGWLFERFVDKGVLPANPHQADFPEDFHFWEEARRGLKATRFDAAFLKDVLVNGVQDSRMVIRWILFGVLLAALLRATLNPEQFTHFFGPTTLGLAVTIAVATVLEVCSEGATPIATDILTRAHAPGNSFAFLMAGVATDYTEMMVLKEASKSWKFALFLPLLTVPQVVLVAWLINTFSY